MVVLLNLLSMSTYWAIHEVRSLSLRLPAAHRGLSNESPYSYSKFPVTLALPVKHLQVPWHMASIHPTCFCNTVYYLEQVARDLEDPFLHEPNDFPHQLCQVGPLNLHVARCAMSLPPAYTKMIIFTSGFLEILTV